ncbi:YcaO-like family protein [Streptomyces aculeolatus]|uniref:YcaO-like family protein n=1 Tax=Streptomyces aculeolatus TaxID=270689 RepID=UPI000998BD30|nr:YcaO-like family protein [Streptomyces aculeolatus]
MQLELLLPRGLNRIFGQCGAPPRKRVGAPYADERSPALTARHTDHQVDLEPLLSPLGVVANVVRLDRRWRSPLPFAHYAATVGSGKPGAGVRLRHHTFCSGRAPVEDAEHARFVSLAEGAERYAMANRQTGETRRASARELAGECLEPARYPRCSAAELTTPGCKAKPFDESADIRWSRATDMVTGRQTWVPAVMLSPFLDDVEEAEKFTHQISTGYSVHSDPVEAMLGAICEIAERDSLAVLWLQKLPLPRVDSAAISETAAEIIEWNRRRFVDVHLFDATLDLGVPTVYCVLSAEHDQRVRRAVGAGTGRRMVSAVEKAVMEATGITGSLRSNGDDLRKPYSDYHSVDDGARFMALPENEQAFDFLTGVPHTEVSAGPVPLPEDPRTALDLLVARLHGAGMRPVFADHTTQELRHVGLTAVRVVIPDLQPMSVDPLMQFKGHVRLYQAPALMGYRSLPEEELNPWPQPLA